MKTLVDLGDKFKDRIATRYPVLQDFDKLEGPEAHLVEHRNEEIEKYHAMFWHRLLKRIYGEPAEIEYSLSVTSQADKPVSDTIILRRTGQTDIREAHGLSEEIASKLNTGEVRMGLPINWKYYVTLPLNGVITLGTKDRHTAFHITHISEVCNTTKNPEEEIRKFVGILLEEAKRMKDQLFNPVKEFERDNGLKLYHVGNVYLANYVSAERMLDMAESEESYLTSEWLKYDPKTNDFFDEEKKRAADRIELARGTFYFSAFSYFFMALEGFVNIVFHAFLKKDLRDRDLNLDQRLDLEQKLRLMTSLCHCFVEDASLCSVVDVKFKKLKKYRNSLFHAKIEDALKTLCFVEDGFFYSYSNDLDDRKERFLPASRGLLSVSDVIQAKAVVDEIVDGILNCMKHDARILTEKHILHEAVILFFLSGSGDLSMTTEDNDS